jgi:hypothetical protein
MYHLGNLIIHYILINEILRNLDEIKCVFSFSVFSLLKFICTAVKHIFRIFTGVLSDYFLLNSASTQNLWESLSNFIAKKEKNVYNKHT